MNSDHFHPDQLAASLLRDYDTQTPGTVFADGRRLSVETAWQLQDAVARLREQRGESVVGYKIGCVCPENQKSNGLQHPVSGRLWSTEQHSNGARLSKDGFANVAIEGEFAVTLNEDVDARDVSPAAVAACVDVVCPVIELHNLVFRGSDPKGPELIANNAIHCGVVRGADCPNPGGELVTDLEITFDGRRVDTWAEIRWPDDILQAVGWLARRLQQSGQSLRRGQLILTGAFGPPRPLPGVRHVRVTTSQFGTVEAWFDDASVPVGHGQSSVQ